MLVLRQKDCLQLRLPYQGAVGVFPERSRSRGLPLNTCNTTYPRNKNTGGQNRVRQRSLKNHQPTNQPKNRRTTTTPLMFTESMKQPNTSFQGDGVAKLSSWLLEGHRNYLNTRAGHLPAQPGDSPAGCSPHRHRAPRHRHRGTGRCRCSEPSSLRQDALVLTSGRAQAALTCVQTSPVQPACRGHPPLLPTGSRGHAAARPRRAPRYRRAQRSPPPPQLRHHRPAPPRRRSAVTSSAACACAVVLGRCCRRRCPSSSSGPSIFSLALWQ